MKFHSNKMEIQHNLLKNSNYSILIEPPFLKPVRNFIGKISNNDDATINEFIIYTKIYKFSPNCSIFPDIKFIDLDKINNTFLKKILSDDLNVDPEKFQNSKYQLTIPKINGVDLQKFFDAYSNITYERISVSEAVNKYPTRDYVISNKIIIDNDSYFKFLSSLSIFIVELIKIKNLGFIHGDLSPRNMIYEQKNNEIKLIDLEMSSFFEPKDIDQEDDNENIKYLILESILLGSFNPEIYKTFIDSGFFNDIFLNSNFDTPEDKKKYMEENEELSEDYDYKDPECNLDVKYNYTNINLQKILEFIIDDDDLKMCIDFFKSSNDLQE